jgi:hypothetical protein
LPDQIGKSGGAVFARQHLVGFSPSFGHIAPQDSVVVRLGPLGAKRNQSPERDFNATLPQAFALFASESGVRLVAM